MSITQAPFALRGHNPDVLTCIANLSNDEALEVIMQAIAAAALAWAVLAYAGLDFGFFQRIFPLTPAIERIYRAGAEVVLAATGRSRGSARLSS